MGLSVPNVSQSAPMRRGEVAGLAVRLHEATTGLSVAIGLLKGFRARVTRENVREADRILAILDDVLNRLRQVSAAVSNNATQPARIARPSASRKYVRRTRTFAMGRPDRA